MVRCTGITKKGKRCKNHAISGSDYCHVHRPKEEPEPWDALNVKPSTPPLNKSTLNKIRKKMKKGPTKKDGCGYIYVYYLREEMGYNHWKIGRTKKSVAKRLKQWGTNCTLQYDWYTEYHEMAERLIHLYLDDVRFYRYPATKKGKSDYLVWKKDGKPVRGGKEDRDRMHAQGKQVEWFHTDWQTISKTIECIVNYVNKL